MYYSEIQNYIANNQFRMATQPIINVNNQKVLYSEALCRIKKHQSGNEYLDTATVIHIAEQDGVVDMIDYAMLEMSLSSPWLLEMSEIGLNISGYSISSPIFIQKTIEALSKTKLSNRIVFEITETRVPQDLHAAIQNLTKLKQAGCKIAIDDFGSGYGSFLYLKNLPIDYIKVSKDFIQDIINDKISTHIVRNLVNLSRDLGVTLIAEYIETKELADYLHKIGVEYMQGYFFNRPVVI